MFSYSALIRSVFVSSNEVHNNIGAGILLQGISHGIVWANNVTNNGSSGIVVMYSDHINVLYGSVHDNGWGIVIAGSNNNKVIGNIVRNNYNWGIALIMDDLGITSNNNVVRFNLAKGNVQFDLYDDGTGTGNVWSYNIYNTKNW
jgi:parallel beta-helix repeat protein